MSPSELERTPERPFSPETRLIPDQGGRTLHDLLVDSATEYAIFALDAEGRVASWNVGAERLKGYAADEIIGRHFSIFYTDEDRGAGLPGTVIATAAGTGRYEAEGWRVRKDGTRFWANAVVTPIRSTGGALLGFAKITRDLTARREAEVRRIELATERGARAEAERRSAELSRLTEQLQEQAIELEAQTDEAQALTDQLEMTNDELQGALARVARLQRATAALSGASTPDAVARVILTEGMAAIEAAAGIVFLLEEDGAHLVPIGSEGYDASVLADWRPVPISADAGIAEVVRTRRPVWLPDAVAGARKYPHLMPSLATRPFGAWCMLPMLVRDRAIGSLSFASANPRAFDADDARLLETFAAQAAQALDRARLYEAERRARAAAEAANRAKTDFLAMMSHELRTPLNAVIGYAQLLEDQVRGPLTPEQRHDVSRIRGAARHLRSLIDALLDQASIEAGRVHLQVAEVPVHDLLGAVEAFIAPQLRAKGLAYRCEPCAPTLAIRADREKTLQILLNLVGNAVKFTESGRLTLSAVDEEARVGLRVADTGPGIPAAQLDRIFEPFVQVSAPMAAPQEGTGLGLAISRALARRMGGDLTVESTVGTGSVFTLTLPRADVSES